MSQQTKKTRLKITNDNVTGANLARSAPVFVCNNVQKRGSEELISSEKGEDPMAA